MIVWLGDCEIGLSNVSLMVYIYEFGFDLLVGCYMLIIWVDNWLDFDIGENFYSIFDYI